MAEFHILSLLLFWRHEQISAFWVDLYERLKENQTAIESVSSAENKSLIGIPKDKNDKAGWLEKIGYPVGHYLNQIDFVTNNKPLNTKSLFQLLKAFRNLVSHKFGCDAITRLLQEQKHLAKKAAEAVTAAVSCAVEKVALETLAMNTGELEESVLGTVEVATAAVEEAFAVSIEAARTVEETEAAAAYLNQLKEKVDEELKEGLVKYWLENFPEFSLITCLAAYDASLIFHQTDLKNILASCKPQYISVLKCKKTKSKHLSLHAYSKALSNWINEEIDKKRTAIWKHSFTTEYGNVTFLGIPDNSAVDLANRETITLDWTPNKLGQTCTLKISRRLVSTSDEGSWLFKKNRGSTKTKENGVTSVNLEFAATLESKTEDCFPFIVFSDVLSSALQACINLPSKDKPRVVFTNQPIDYIKSVVDQFCKSRQLEYSSNSISWNHLSTEYKKELSGESFPLHEHSNVKLNLYEICNLDVNEPSNWATKPETNVDTHTHSVVNTNSGSSSDKTHRVNDSLFDIDSMLLEFMHDKSRLLDTFIENQENYISRDVSLNSGAPVHQDELVSLISNKSTQKSKNFYLIYGAACTGKSTFLAELGRSLVCNNQLVLYTTCLKITSLFELHNHNFVDILYCHNKFQQRVAHYVLMSQRYPVTIIIDNFDDLCEKEEKKRLTFFTRFLMIFLKEYEDVVINIFMAARSKKIFEESILKCDLEKNAACSVNCLQLKGLGNNKREKYMKTLFPSAILSSTIVNNYVKDCMQFINDEFGQLAVTPFACKIIVEICHDVKMKSQGSLDTEKLTGPYFYEQFHNLHLREAFARILQNHDVPKELMLNSATLNMSSSIFQLLKESSEMHLGNESLKIRSLDCNLRLEERVEYKKNVLAPGSVFDLVRLSETFVPDYHCALLIFKHKDFFTEKVFNFKDNGKTSLQYYHILNFLDKLLHGQKSRLGFKQNFNIRIKDIHHTLFVLMHQRLYYVFFEAVEMLYGKFEGNDTIWSTRQNDINRRLKHVMKKAIKYNALNSIKFLVKHFEFDWGKFRLRSSILQMGNPKYALNDVVLQYLMGIVSSEITAVDGDLLKFLVINCLTKNSKRVFLVNLLKNGNPNQIYTIQESCVSLYTSDEYEHLQNELGEILCPI